MTRGWLLSGLIVGGTVLTAVTSYGQFPDEFDASPPPPAASAPAVSPRDASTPNRPRPASPAERDPRPVDDFWDTAPATDAPSYPEPSRPSSPGRPWNSEPDGAAEPAAPTRPPVSFDGGLTINPELLKPVTDRTMGISPSEEPAYRQILQYVRRLPASEIRQLAREVIQQRREEDARLSRRADADFPVFEELYLHPEDFRGRPVVLRGAVRKLLRHPASPESGRPDIFEAWIYTADSQRHPAVVISSLPPRGLVPGDELYHPVEVAGYFFKHLGYEAQDQTRVAPLILAGEVRSLVRPQIGRRDAPVWWYGVLGLGALWFMVAIWTKPFDRRLMATVSNFSWRPTFRRPVTPGAEPVRGESRHSASHRPDDSPI